MKAKFTLYDGAVVEGEVNYENFNAIVNGLEKKFIQITNNGKAIAYNTYDIKKVE